jgi:endonuclease/exonuclease/phosphatase family metal-dependent hydrolase
MNLWHGLSPANLIAFERLEPTPRREMREKMQLELFQKIKPDIAFFQECNPVSKRFSELASSLKMHGDYQPDLVGIKVLGMGLPLNLFSGLVQIARPEWPLKKVASVRLSGNNSFVNRWVSFQLKEERYALFCETMRPGIGKILLINTHLHHGLEATEEFTEKMHAAVEEMKLSPSLKSEIRHRLAVGNERRAREMSALLKELQVRQGQYAIVIMGGDFNAEPRGELGQRLRDLGFSDVWRKDHHDEPGFTYDREQNIANHILQDRFPSTFMVEDLSFSAKTKETLLKLVLEQERRPRRIDQLWVRSQLGQVKSIRSQLIGFPDQEGMAPSDHFGLVADLDIE